MSIYASSGHALPSAWIAMSHIFQSDLDLLIPLVFFNIQYCVPIMNFQSTDTFSLLQQVVS